MRKIRIILRNGRECTVICNTAKATTTAGSLTGYSFGGIVKGRPLFLSIPDIVAIIDENAVLEGVDHV